MESQKVQKLYNAMYDVIAESTTDAAEDLVAIEWLHATVLHDMEKFFKVPILEQSMDRMKDQIEFLRKEIAQETTSTVSIEPNEQAAGQAGVP